MDQAFLKHIQWVMVGTTLPDNIGAAARALKTMGGSQLILVSPKSFPHEQATALAAGAVDVLESAKVVATLQEAIADSHLVFATSSRNRSIAWPLVSAREAATLAYANYHDQQFAQTHGRAFTVSMVFGREDRGLTNEELSLAHYHAYIPANEDYGVLNVAAAMQLFSYEMRMAAMPVAQAEGKPANSPDAYLPRNEEWVSAGQMEQFYNQLEGMLEAVEFYDPHNPRNMPIKLRRLFNRVRLNAMEYNLLRGLWVRTTELAKLARGAKADTNN